MTRTQPTEVRRAFMTAIVALRPLLHSSSLARSWDQPSALERMTVGGLAAHLGRALFNVERYLNASVPEPQDEGVASGTYFAAILTTNDLDAPVNSEVRDRSEADAAAGLEVLLERFDAALTSLDERLASEPATRKVRVYGGIVMRLDDYLITRLVECVVHADDLAVSVGTPLPDLDASVMQFVVEAILDVARTRHGDLAVIRAMARRERDELQALRVF